MRKQMSILISIVVVLSLVGCGIVGIPVKKDVISSYEGPIFHLESLEKVDGITVNREIKMAFPNTENLGSANYDFVNDSFHGNALRFAQVVDQYEISNSNSEDVTMQMVYPFEAKFASAAGRVPVISTFEAGPVSSQVVLGRTILTEAYTNIQALNDQRCYQVLMGKGEYMQDSISSYMNSAALDQAVKVYKLEGIGCRTNEQEKMELEVSISRDTENSQVYTYGFDTFGWKDNQDVLGTSVPLKNEADFEKDAYIIVTGDDIELSEILCYRTAQKEYYDWEEIAAFELDSYESTLEDVMAELLNDYRSSNELPQCFGDFVTNQVFLDACKQFLIDTEEERGVGITSLDHSVFATMEAEYGMHFMLFDVTVPANDSVKLYVKYDKPANVVEENKEGYDTYDIMLRYVSNLSCESTKIGFILDDYTQIRLGGPEGDILKDGTYDMTSWTDLQLYLEQVEK